MTNESLIDGVIKLLKHLKVDVSKNRFVNNNIMISCPFAHIGGHKDGMDKKPSFGIKLSDKGLVFNCFTCERKGRSFIQLIELLMEEGVIDSDTDAYKLQNAIKVKFPKFYADKSIDSNKIPYESSVYSKLTKEFFAYNKSRGVSPVIVNMLELKYDGENKRVIFSCYNYNKKFVGFVEGSIQGKGYSNNLDTGSSLYLEWLIEDGTVGIVVEGMYDAVRVYALLYELELLDKYSVVGLYGAKVSNNQIKLLGDYFDRLMLMGDNDVAGIKMEKTIYKFVHKRVPLVKKLIYDGKDPACIKSKYKFKRYLKKSKFYNVVG